MNRGTIYNAEPFGYSHEAVEAWEKKGFHYKEGSWNEVGMQPSFPGVVGLVVRLGHYVGSDVLEKFPDLKFVVSATTGHDHLDTELFKEKDIKLYSLRPHREFLDTIPSTAEHTWALLTSLLRNVAQADLSVSQGHWDRDAFRGNQLKGKVLGIVGLGRTGLKVARYAEAFEMKVNYFDPYVENSAYQREMSLSSLLENSDIISLHVHLNKETTCLINSENLTYCKPGAFLVNTSRGMVWEESGIMEALKQGKIAGVATDVLHTELLDIKESPLWKAKKAGFNVLITPHVGGATWEAMWECEKYITQTVE